MKYLNSILICILLSVAGCGGGGGGSSWSGARNPEGFPDVRGTYRITYSQINYTCSDGSSDSAPASSQNVTVTQSGNALAFDSNADGFTAGFVVTRDRNATGTIGTDGDFTADRAVEGIVNNSISTAINSFYSGQFFPSGFSGDVEYTAVFAELNASCTYRATYDASKIS